MATREPLSPTQRQRLTELPDPMDERLLARYHTLSAGDLTVIGKRRRPDTKLGFATQLCYLRFPGRPIRSGEQPPANLLGYVASQLGEDPAVFDRYACGRDTTRREHLLEIVETFGFHSFDEEVYQELREWVTAVAMSTERGTALVEAVLGEMRQRGIVAPAVSTVEELCWEARYQARSRVFKALTGEMSVEDRRRLDDLMAVPPSGARAPLVWLREPSGAAAPKNFHKVLERLRFVRSLDLPKLSASGIHNDRLVQLAREGHKTTPQHLRRFDDDHRHATLVAYLSGRIGSLTDEALDMHDRLMGEMLGKGEKARDESFHKRGKAINEKVGLYASVGKASISARDSGEDPYALIEQLIAWERFVASVSEAEELPESLRETAERARAFFDDSRAENTKRSYASDFEDFATYCRVDAGGLSSLPASPKTVTLYITDLEGRGLKAATIQRRLSAISQIHRRAGYESPANNDLVRETFKGIKRKVGSRQREAAPLTLAVMREVFEAMDEEVSAAEEHKSENVRRAKRTAALRDRALLLVGFAAALRRSEICALLVSDISEVEEGMKLLLRRSKTDQEGAGELVGLPYGSQLETCPVRNLRRWISFCGTWDAVEEPLFCSVDRHGKLGANGITPDAIHKLVKKRVGAAGLDPEPYSGHSLRAGLPTTASGMGVGIESWMRQSRHKTFAVAARYAREPNLFKDNAAAMVGM